MQRLDEMGDRVVSPSIFMEQIKKLILKLIDVAKEQSGIWDFQQFDLTQFQGKQGSKKEVINGNKSWEM
ncbi:hypothetical protein OCA28_16995 [Bacillus cereus]|nr:hypothetical protein [Bacillus cereus]